LETALFIGKKVEDSVHLILCLPVLTPREAPTLHPLSSFSKGGELAPALLKCPPESIQSSAGIGFRCGHDTVNRFGGRGQAQG